MKKKPLAFLMALLLIAAFPAAAFADVAHDSGEIGGGSTVNDVTINVVVPTNVDFALDPLSQSNTNNQVGTADYFFVNATVVPVKVELNLTAVAADGVTLVGSPDDVFPDDTTATDNDIFFAALGSGVDLSADPVYALDADTNIGTVDVSGITGDYDYTTAAATRVAFTPGTGGATAAAIFGFALDKATPESEGSANVNLADENGSVGVFQFYGALNTYATWEDNDVIVTGSYALTPLRGNTYTAYAGTILEGSLNQIDLSSGSGGGGGPAYSGPGFILSGTTTTAITLATAVADSKASTTNIEIPFYFAGASTGTLTMNGSYTIPAGDYTIDTANNKLILVKYNAPSSTWNSASTGTKTIVLTLGSTSYNFTVNITN